MPDSSRHEALQPGAAATLRRLALPYRERVMAPSRRAVLALGALAVLGGAHLARMGTPAARGAVAAAVLVVCVLAGVLAWRRRRLGVDTDWTLRRVVAGADRRRARDAFRLVTAAERDREWGSPDLARLHLERLVDGLASGAVPSRAAALGRRWQGVALALAACALCSVVLGPLRVVEGLDVLLARRGVAPLPLGWLDSVEVTVQPPAYLRLAERRVAFGLPTALPRGSVVVVRGVPRVPGRTLVLAGGAEEAPFLDDGNGRLVARTTLDQDRELRVGARFGGVLIPEPDGWAVAALADTAPVVQVAEAPRTWNLAELERLDLTWTARDDHGLRQVDLVVTSGERAERQTLARFDDVTRFEQGGHSVDLRHPMIRRAYLPVTVRVEARDGDPVAGVKWGRSEAVTLLPAPVGEREARRMQKLLEGRDALVDHLRAVRGASGEAARDAERRKAARAAIAPLERAIEEVPLGAALPPGFVGYLRGQLEALTRPLRPGESAVRRTEDVLLAVDAGIRNLARRDAASVARLLGDVVEEIELGARSGEGVERGARLQRIDAALDAARRGAVHLAALGDLGHDLGGVARADLGRIERARALEALGDVEWAARHLAQRLRRPQPSFSSLGGGGVESGAGSGKASGPPEPTTQADRQFDQLSDELEELVARHGEEIGKVERALERAEGEDGRRGEPERAEALRRALQGLPLRGSRVGSAREQAALAREHGGQMADALQEGDLERAVTSGKEARRALAEARRRAREAPEGDTEPEALDRADRALSEELAWAERELERRRDALERRARPELAESGRREREHARRAGNLASRGKAGEAALPEAAGTALERAETLMNDAARELAEGRGERALRLQREAQRLLEEASRGRADPGETGENPSPADREGQGRALRRGGEVPGASAEDRAAAFRKRVIEGLSRGKSGRLGPTVQRYAEGLLR